MPRLNHVSARRSRVLLLRFAAALGAFAIGFAPKSAEAAPTARFTATPVQGTTCVAPCIVHLDATATTDTNTSRPFHELDYAWSCGETGRGQLAESIRRVEEYAARANQRLRVRHAGHDSTSAVATDPPGRTSGRPT